MNNESDRLVAYVSLEKDISQIEGQINAVESMINFLTEYRNRLAAEYVTKRKELEEI